MKSFLESFIVMREAPREIWIIYLTKVLEIIAYGLMSSTLVLWLSSDLGFSDSLAGDTIALWSTIMTLCTVLVGSLVDSVGIKKSFITGFVLCVGSRLIMTASDTRWIAIGLGMLPMAVGHAMMIPVMNAALKIYSTVRQRTLSFALFYTAMNIGFAVAGWVFDFVRGALGEYGSQTLLGMELSTYRVLFFWATVATIPGLLVTWFGMREGVEATEEGIRIRTKEPKYKDHSLLAGTLLSARDAGRDTIRTFVSVWGQSSFYRFIAFLALVTMVKLIFYHMHFTFPKYGIRELGEGAPIGRLWSVLNPVTIVILVPLLGAVSSGLRAYTMIAVGSSLSAVSVVFMALPRAWFQGLADGWFGNLIAHTWLGVEGPVNPLYVSITLFVLMFSVGEAIWSPRLYEYTAAIAPKGREGSYMALSLLPYFVAKLFVGMLSGRLLEAYCPAEGPRSSETLWLIIALMSLICPVGIVLLRRYISSQEAGRDQELKPATA